MDHPIKSFGPNVRRLLSGEFDGQIERLEADLKKGMDFPVLKRGPGILKGHSNAVMVYDDDRQIVAAGATDVEAMENFLAAEEAHERHFGLNTPSPDVPYATDEQLRNYTQLLRHEPGLHQVNMVNQHKGAADIPDPRKAPEDPNPEE